MSILSILGGRRAGILLHITSLPPTESDHRAKGMLGDLGGAQQFIDFLNQSGVSVWQVLPLNPPYSGLSPYSCTSSAAGNPMLIDLHVLCELGWLGATLEPEKFDDVNEYRLACLSEAYQTFKDDEEYVQELDAFSCEHQGWLNEFSLFTAISRSEDGRSWHLWPENLRDRDSNALQNIACDLADIVAQVKFEQFLFFQQWQALKEYAHEKGILLFGDIPLYVSHNSADVWLNRDYFRLDQTGGIIFEAGVPPDEFSEHGQRWGTPVYNWEALAMMGFRWWIERFERNLLLYDIIKIDHFRGLVSCWELETGSNSPCSGKWVDVPGEALLSKLQLSLGSLSIVAEDLGTVDASVHLLRQKFNIPGMKVMQFAFNGRDDNPYLLSHHEENCVVYTGTHDNDTSLAWYKSLNESQQKEIDLQLSPSGFEIPWSLIEYIFSSVAVLVIIPMQDILSLGAGNRMNEPGSASNNWCWQFRWEQISQGLSSRLKCMIGEHQRLPRFL